MSWEKMTYIEALEAQGGTGPKSARERNLLNIMVQLCLTWSWLGMKRFRLDL